jgi:protein-S-isoprenylcysteine O-methyltransferase Ste14
MGTGIMGKTLHRAVWKRRELNMKKCEGFVYGLNPWILSAIAAILIVLQIILCLFLPNRAGLQVLRYLGYVTWGIGAAFGIIPIFTLRRKGGVLKGKSYVHTTIVVKSGMYAFVRHPQGGVAGILLSLALILIGQTWAIAALGVVSIALIYLDTLKTDQYELDKFGDEYKRYMETVPRVNFVAGALRLLRDRKRRSKGTGSHQRGRCQDPN